MLKSFSIFNKKKLTIYKFIIKKNEKSNFKTKKFYKIENKIEKGNN